MAARQTYNPITNGFVEARTAPARQSVYNPITGGASEARTGLRVLPDVRRGDPGLLKHEPLPKSINHGQLGRDRNPITQETESSTMRPTMRPAPRLPDQVSALLDQSRIPAPTLQPANRASATAVLPMLANPQRRAIAQENFNYKSKVQEKYAAMYAQAFDASREVRNAAAQHRVRERLSNEVFYMPSNNTRDNFLR
eukprot:TRINITY_DN37_c1_g1_i1.p1 TRINITY_DN37_c1_g1~~TRINITY_DN37_c1_g1_i1.p1  ORF type:complete len:197 (+),score=25.29 TRINITY_DN37_c1_g1_i1:185-775(+)